MKANRIYLNCLTAKSDEEIDEAFDQIFDVVDQARRTGEFSEFNRFINWMIRESVIHKLNISILLSALRLTSNVRQEIVSWRSAVQAVEEELSKRGTAKIDALLWGLK